MFSTEAVGFEPTSLATGGFQNRPLSNSDGFQVFDFCKVVDLRIELSALGYQPDGDNQSRRPFSVFLFISLF